MLPNMITLTPLKKLQIATSGQSSYSISALKRAAVTTFFTLLAFTSSQTAVAADPIPAAPDIPAVAYYVQDFHSGRVLASKNAEMRVPPASLTKMMTAYVAFRALQTGQLTLEETIKVSRKADAQIGSMMAIREGDVVNAEQLIKGVVVMSGNDSAVALAELVAGTEESFTDLMNQTAQKLGMKDTKFANSSGLPAAKTAEEDAQLHYSTAKDLAILSAATIRDFPEYYPWFAEKEYGYKDYVRKNRNTLLFDDTTVDGLKTGHTKSAGYCLVASANRNGMRLISVVLGTDTKKARAETSSQLLRYGYRFYETRTLIQAQQKVADVRVWYGENEALGVAPSQNVYVTFPRGSIDNLKTQIKLNGQIEAPVTKGQTVGQLDISLDGELLTSTPIVATQSIGEGSWWAQMGDWIEQGFSDSE